MTCNQEIFLGTANKQFEGFLTAKSVTDIYYLTHRCTHSDKETRQILNKLFCLSGLLDTAGMDCRKEVPFNLSDFEDAVMTESAIREEMDCIVTRNLGDYKKAALTVYSPEEFLLNMK